MVMSTEAAAKFVGSIPENYDAGLGPVLFLGWADEVARQVGRMKPSSVLELAAGTGILTRALYSEMPAGSKLIATDLNLPMLDIAKTKIEEIGNVTFEQADATDLKYNDASFDLVVCQFGVMFFPDKKRSHEEVLRVLKPGGTYLFTLWDSWQANPFGELIHETIGQFFPEDPPAFYKVPYGYTDTDEIRDLVLEAGFENVGIDKPSIISRIASARGFARGLVFGNPLYQEVLSRGGNPEDICVELEEVIKKDMGDELVLKIIKVLATKADS